MEEPNPRDENMEAKQPVLQRVTQEDSAPKPNSTTKDPKKVAAGRKGAQARKAKQEHLQAELRKMKSRIAPQGTPDTVEETDVVSQQEPPVASQPVPQGVKERARQAKAAYPWLPWAIAGVGLFVVFYGRNIYEWHKAFNGGAPQGTMPSMRGFGVLPKVQGATSSPSVVPAVGGGGFVRI